MKSFFNFSYFSFILVLGSCFVPKDKDQIVSSYKIKESQVSIMSQPDSLTAGKLASQYVSKSLVFVNFMEAFALIDPDLRRPDLADDFFSRELYLKVNPSVGVISSKTIANIFPIQVWQDSIQYKIVFEGLDGQFLEEFKKEYLKRNRTTEKSYNDYIINFVLTPESEIIPRVLDSMKLTVVKRNCEFYIRPYEDAYLK